MRFEYFTIVGVQLQVFAPPLCINYVFFFLFFFAPLNTLGIKQYELY